MAFAYASLVMRSMNDDSSNYGRARERRPVILGLEEPKTFVPRISAILGALIAWSLTIWYTAPSRDAQGALEPYWTFSWTFIGLVSLIVFAICTGSAVGCRKPFIPRPVFDLTTAFLIITTIISNIYRDYSKFGPSQLVTLAVGIVYTGMCVKLEHGGLQLLAMFVIHPTIAIASFGSCTAFSPYRMFFLIPAIIYISIEAIVCVNDLYNEYLDIEVDVKVVKKRVISRSTEVNPFKMRPEITILSTEFVSTLEDGKSTTPSEAESGYSSIDTRIQSSVDKLLAGLKMAYPLLMMHMHRHRLERERARENGEPEEDPMDCGIKNEFLIRTSGSVPTIATIITLLVIASAYTGYHCSPRDRIYATPYFIPGVILMVLLVISLLVLLTCRRSCKHPDSSVLFNYITTVLLINGILKIILIHYWPSLQTACEFVALGLSPAYIGMCLYHSNPLHGYASFVILLLSLMVANLASDKDLTLEGRCMFLLPALGFLLYELAVACRDALKNRRKAKDLKQSILSQELDQLEKQTELTNLSTENIATAEDGKSTAPSEAESGYSSIDTAIIVAE